MVFSRCGFFLICMLQVLVLVVITEALVPQVLLSIECLGGNYTDNSTYQRNLNTLLPSLPSAGNGNGYGFYNSSFGENEDKVYGVALCRPFVDPDACQPVATASVLLATISSWHAHLRRRLLHGTTIAPCATRTAPSTAPWKLSLFTLDGTHKTYQHWMWMGSITSS